MAFTKITKKKAPEPLAASKDAHRDVLPRTGLGAGATMVDGASKFLASYGKSLSTLALAVIVGLAAWWLYQSYTSTSERDLRNRIDQAAAVGKFDELHGKMEVVIAEAKDEKRLQAYAQYRYAIRAYDLMATPYKAEELKRVAGILSGYLDEYGKDESYTAWNQRLAGLQQKVSADLAFFENPDKSNLLPWDHHTKFEKPEVVEVESGNPIVVFKTSEGDVRFELFQDQAPNAVKHFVSLCEEGFFDRTSFTAAAYSNNATTSGPYRGATVMTAGKEGRPIGVELKKPGDAKEGDDVDTQPAKNPYTIDYEGSNTHPFRPGTIALCREESDPNKARTEFLIAIEPSAALGVYYLPLGQIVGGEAELDRARRLGSAKIHTTWVERKVKGFSYVPTVHYDGWPVVTLKRDKKPEPVRYGKLEQVIDDKQNPLVVIELKNGDILIELFEDVCPNTVKNFINLIEERFYDIDCEFYRVEGTGVEAGEIYKSAGARIIQGGNDQSQSRAKYDYTIRNEAVDNEKYDRYFRLTPGGELGGLANARGTVAMARKNELDSASTEFYVNLRDYPDFDNKNSPYCVFGRVIEGLDVAARVAKDDPILSAKVIRKRSGDYVPEVKYKDGGWKPKDKVEPASEEDIKKYRERVIKEKDESKPAASPSPSFTIGG